MPMQSQYARCRTPPQCEESLSSTTASDDEIPHLLRPDDDPCDDFDPEDEQDQQNPILDTRTTRRGHEPRFLVQGFPSPRGGNHDLTNASPISSITSCTRGERSVVSSFTNLLPPVTPSSRESSRSTSSSSGNSGKSSSMSVIMARGTTGDLQTQEKFRCKTPPSPIQLSPSSSSTSHDRSSRLFLKVKPRSAEYGSLSPIHKTPVLTSSPRSLDGVSIAKSTGSSSVRSSTSRSSSQRKSYKRREMSQPHSLRPPLGTSIVSNGRGDVRNGSSHRRSTSLNLPSSYSSSSTFSQRRKKEDYGLWPLKEGKQVVDEFHTQSMRVPFDSTFCDLEKTKHHSNASHRRTVSFPDEVFRQGRGPTLKSRRYNDVMLESDDPALFSLIETTQARRDGRVFIATDVDPFLASSGFSSFQSSVSDGDCEVERQHREVVGVGTQQVQNVLQKQKHARVASMDDKMCLHREKGIANVSSGERKLARSKSKSSGSHNSSKGLDWKQTFPITTLPEHYIAEDDDDDADGLLDSFKKLCETFPSCEREKALKCSKDETIRRSNKKGTKKLSRTTSNDSTVQIKHSKDEILHTEKTVGHLEFQKCCNIQ